MQIEPGALGGAMRRKFGKQGVAAELYLGEYIFKVASNIVFRR